MPTQQQNPNASGLPPVLINLMILVFKPIAAIASTIKNLLSSFNGVNTSAETPAFTAIVVIKDAPIKYNIKIGNTFLK